MILPSKDVSNYSLLISSIIDTDLELVFRKSHYNKDEIVAELKHGSKSIYIARAALHNNVEELFYELNSFLIEKAIHNVISK